VNTVLLRQLSLRGFVGFLSLTALIAVVTVLVGNFGELQGKILASSFSVSIASICAMSGAVFMESRGPRWLGVVGIVIALLGLVLINVGLWFEPGSWTYWKFVFVFVVVSLGLAHGFLLQLPSLNLTYKWVQPLSAISIALLVALISGALIWEWSGDWLWRGMTVVAIVVVLCSALIPILLRLGASSTARVKLVLELLEDGLYQSADGRRFEVRELEA
jgi:hypothetical protein